MNLSFDGYDEHVLPNMLYDKILRGESLGLPYHGTGLKLGLVSIPYHGDKLESLGLV